MPTIAHYDKAIDSLNGVIQIAKNEMLQQGLYISEVRDEKLAEQGAICGGRNACLVGSLWLGYGIKPVGDALFPELPGTDDDERRKFIRNRPGLRLALDALNEEAIKEGGPVPADGYFSDAAEHYFERTLKNRPQPVVKAEVIKLAQRAKRKLQKQRRDAIAA